jgi:galactose mutarotase-like enzyme
MSIQPVTIGSESLALECYPQHGFAITSIVAREHGTEILWRSPLTSPRELGSELGESGDISGLLFDKDVLLGGWFSMFPTAGHPASFNDRWMHGEAPRVSWAVESHSDSQVECTVTLPSSGLTVRRRVSVRGNTVSVTMSAHNPTAQDRTITFGEHPCFPRELFAGGRVELPGPSHAGVGPAIQPAASVFRHPDAFEWPSTTSPDGSPLDAGAIPAQPDGRHDHVSVCPPRGEAVLHGPGLSVALAWDVDAMPGVLLWEHFLPEGSMWPADVFGVEPVSSSGRTMDDAAAASDIRTILAGGDVSYWMTLTVESGR